MESVNEIKEALSARSRTATLDELRSEGRKRVRLIRAEHIAAMVSEAVHAAIEESGLIDKGEVDRLVDKSRQEFKSILREREQELQRAQDNEQLLAERGQELDELKVRFGSSAAALADARGELEQAHIELSRKDRELHAAQIELNDARSYLAEAQSQLAELRNELEEARSAPAASASSPAGPANADLLMSMMNEMATMKAQLLQRGGSPAPAAAAGGGAAVDFTAAIEKLTGSLNDRLESIGRKVGISSAVESDAPIDFGGLFRDADKSLESNMDNIQVKQKAGGGIAANLARLKKLKGGN